MSLNCLRRRALGAASWWPISVAFEHMPDACSGAGGYCPRIIARSLHAHDQKCQLRDGTFDHRLSYGCTHPNPLDFRLAADPLSIVSLDPVADAWILSSDSLIGPDLREVVHDNSNLAGGFCLRWTP